MSLEVKIKKKLKEFTLESELNVETGCTGLMGPSGSGKSITLKCIAGVETADSGRIVLDGKILYDSEKKIDLPPQKRKIGYLFQGYALFPNMTIEENIKTGLRAKGFPKDEIEQKTNDMMKRFHIEELAKRYPRQISGGQKQRTALARMLVCEPEVILMDEPFSALDEYLREQMQDELSNMLAMLDKPAILQMQQFGYPVIMDVTHSLQQPNQTSGVTGGLPALIETIAKAAIAVGTDGLFIETHPEPSKAKSDGANMLQLDLLEEMLTKLVRIREAVRSN